MILLSEMENLFAQLIVGPAATEQRQIDVALSLGLHHNVIQNNCRWV